MSQFLSEWPLPPSWIIVCTQSQPIPFLKTHPSCTHTDTVPQFTVAVTAPLLRRPGPLPPLLSYLLRSTILHKLPFWEDNKPYLHTAWVQLHTDCRCNLHLCKWSHKIETTPLWVQQRYCDNQPVLFYAFRCGNHLGNIKLSESYENHIFNLWSPSPLFYFNYLQGKPQGGGR